MTSGFLFEKSPGFQKRYLFLSRVSFRNASIDSFENFYMISLKNTYNFYGLFNNSMNFFRISLRTSKKFSSNLTKQSFTNRTKDFFRKPLMDFLKKMFTEILSRRFLESFPRISTRTILGRFPKFLQEFHYKKFLEKFLFQKYVRDWSTYFL